MDLATQNLKGSPARDAFKRRHKDIGPAYYGIDVDFILIVKHPPGIAAFVDFKKPGDRCTFAEVIGYNELQRIAPVFFAVSPNADYGPFTIWQYTRGDWRPDPPRVYVCRTPVVCRDWEEWRTWENNIRESYRKRAIHKVG